MRITDKAIDEFIAIYREEFEEEISRKDAGEMASEIVSLYEALAKRLPNDVDHVPSDEVSRQQIGFRV